MVLEVESVREMVPPAPPFPLLLPPLAVMVLEVVDEAREMVPPLPP